MRILFCQGHRWNTGHTNVVWNIACRTTRMNNEESDVIDILKTDLSDRVTLKYWVSPGGPVHYIHYSSVCNHGKCRIDRVHRQ